MCCHDQSTILKWQWVCSIKGHLKPNRSCANKWKTFAYKQILLHSWQKLHSDTFIERKSNQTKLISIVTKQYNLIVIVTKPTQSKSHWGKNSTKMTLNDVTEHPVEADVDVDVGVGVGDVLGLWDFCAVAVYFGLILGVGISVKKIFILKLFYGSLKNHFKIKTNY